MTPKQIMQCLWGDDCKHHPEMRTPAIQCDHCIKEALSSAISSARAVALVNAAVAAESVTRLDDYDGYTAEDAASEIRDRIASKLRSMAADVVLSKGGR